MPQETISDFANMCIIHDVGSDYQILLTNSYSRTTYVIQISKILFDKSMEDRVIWDSKPFKVSELKPKIPVMTS